MILIGALITGIAFVCVDFRPERFSTVKTVDRHFEFTEPVTDYSIAAGCPEVRFERSPNDVLTVHATVNEKTPLSVSVSDGILCIAPEKELKWYDFIEIDLSEQSVVISLPQTLYEKRIGNE